MRYKIVALVIGRVDVADECVRSVRNAIVAPATPVATAQERGSAFLFSSRITQMNNWYVSDAEIEPPKPRRAWRGCKSLIRRRVFFFFFPLAYSSSSYFSNELLVNFKLSVSDEKSGDEKLHASDGKPERTEHWIVLFFRIRKKRRTVAFVKIFRTKFGDRILRFTTRGKRKLSPVIKMYVICFISEFSKFEKIIKWNRS